MDISKKGLIISAIINLVLIAICVVCLIFTKFNTIVLWICLAIFACVLITSILIYLAGKNYRKTNN